jgi:hypothetical protein
VAHLANFRTGTLLSPSPSLNVGPTGQTLLQPSAVTSSLETVAVNSSFKPLYSLPVSSPPLAYKYPSASAPFSLCFPSDSSPGHRGIARRNPAFLQRSPVDSDLTSEPRASSSPLPPSPLSGAPYDDFILI